MTFTAFICHFHDTYSLRSPSTFMPAANMHDLYIITCFQMSCVHISIQMCTYLSLLTLLELIFCAFSHCEGIDKIVCFRFVALPSFFALTLTPFVALEIHFFTNFISIFHKIKMKCFCLLSLPAQLILIVSLSLRIEPIFTITEKCH